MTGVIASTCANCALATWQLTDKGNPRASVPGRCGWRPEEVKLPISAIHLRKAISGFRPQGIWLRDSLACQTFEAKK